MKEVKGHEKWSGANPEYKAGQKEKYKVGDERFMEVQEREVRMIEMNRHN